MPKATRRTEPLARPLPRSRELIRRAARASATSLLAAAVIGAAGGGCVTEPPPFDVRDLQRTELARAARPGEIGEGERRPLPTTLPAAVTKQERRTNATPFTGNEPTVRMSLQEIIQRSVANNSEVKVAAYEPAIEQTRVVEAEARFDPVFFSNLTFQEQYLLSPTDSFIITDPFNNPSIFRTITTSAGVRQDLPSGGRVEARYQIQRIDRQPESSINPYYVNELVLQLTQPLLRDFGNEVNRARITIAQNNAAVSRLEFRRSLEENLIELEDAYWQLVQAVRQVRIQEDILNRTIETGRILEERRIAGADVTVVETSQTQLSIKTRQAELVRARARVKDISDEIKRRMNDAEFPVSAAIVVLPDNTPLEQPVSFDDLGEQIDTAMENRPELAQQQFRISSAEIASRVARNNLFPQLNLVGQVSLQGPGEEVSDAIQSQTDVDFVSYQVGLQFEIPFGNRAARAIWRRSLLQRMQAIEQYRALVAQVAQDVSTAAREVNTTWAEIAARRAARFAAESSLRAVQARREQDEALTPTFVRLILDTEERLANAQSEEELAIQRYNVAIARLERAKGTLLRYNNVVLEEENLPG